jgi:DNA repair exonuclease SbcCD nuclease subunit
VGDVVQLQLKGGDVNQSPGYIQEVRGRGWYTIQLLETNETIKCRGTQLQVADTSSSSSSFENTGSTRASTKRSPATVTSTPTISTTANGPVFTIDPGNKPEFALPPPTIHDLDAAMANLEQVSNARDKEYLKQVAHHATYDTWVVFTDLHCSPSSLETCLQVLTKVHDVALSKHAGVLFLGDFWHHRGTLRVDCLNAVLEHFKTWQVPMILIPGNHDQVTLGGHNHGLTPFENAYRVGDVAGPLIWSYPTKFRDALFVPHIRDICTMECILQSPTAQKEVSALFVHADVTGAYMNDLIVSQGGIPPSSFPPHKHIYSGHFHKPHTVQSGHTKIQYLGSPYQTSLSEAQQAKSLAVLDARWQCQEYIPLNIGRKHFKVHNWQELLQLRIIMREDDSTTFSDGMVKAGDRVVVSIPKEETESIQPAVKTHIKELRQAGATVEIREIKNLPIDSMGDGGVGTLTQIEDMTPESTWKAFLEQAVHRQSMTESKGEILLAAGLELVEEVQDEEKVQADQSSVATDLQLTSMTLEGFGPFRETVTYPLWNRGLVLLRGTNNDGGSDRYARTKQWC